jgi:hypothetical protein
MALGMEGSLGDTPRLMACRNYPAQKQNRPRGKTTLATIAISLLSITASVRGGYRPGGVYLLAGWPILCRPDGLLEIAHAKRIY